MFKKHSSEAPASSDTSKPTPPINPSQNSLGANGLARVRGVQTTPTPVHVSAPSARTLVVGRGITVKGSIAEAEQLVVEGTVETTTITARELIVPQGGVFRGNADVETVDLAGTIDGTLNVRGNLTVQATGRLLGKAECHRLQVEDGGQITGQLEMITAARPGDLERKPLLSEADSDDE